MGASCGGWRVARRGRGTAAGAGVVIALAEMRLLRLGRTSQRVETSLDSVIRLPIMNEKVEVLLGVAAQYVLHHLRFGWKVPRPEKGDYVGGNWHSWPAVGRQLMLSLLVLASLVALPMPANTQSLPATGASTTPGQPPYTRPTQAIKLRNYLFDAFGPYPIVGAALTAGISQASNGIPEWKQGAEGYGKRIGSDFGIAAVSTTTRYALSEAFKQDAMYYRCECTGVFPRLRHAVISTLTARRGSDGHRVFSFPALVAPYVGTMTAVYGWYPDRYGAKDALRLGNYNLLAYVGGNIALEFLYSGPHSLLSRMHLNSRHGAPNSGSNP